MPLSVGVRDDQSELNQIKHLVWVHYPGKPVTADDKQTSCHDACTPILNGYIHRYLPCYLVHAGGFATSSGAFLRSAPPSRCSATVRSNEGWRGSMIRGM